MKQNRRIVFFLLYFTLISTSECLKFASLDVTFKKGLHAYEGERWSECIVQFEESLHLYKLYKSININCRLQCKSDIEVGDKIVMSGIEDLQIYEKFFKTQNCISSCKRKAFENVHMYEDINDFTLKSMKLRIPYEYLHMCYFHMNALPKAASAAFTFSIANPDSSSMKDNVEYYINQPEVDAKEVVDLESEKYVVLYELGVKAYDKKNWAETVADMEEVLMDYMSWENGCRVECESNTVADSSPEFTETVSNNIAQLLQCKQTCQDKLKQLDFQSGVEFLAEVLNYLQISYYRLERYSDAASAVATFLQLIPDDIDMLENKRMYTLLTDDSSFIAKEDVLYYSVRDMYEKRLIDFYLKNFLSEDNSVNNSI